MMSSRPIHEKFTRTYFVSWRWIIPTIRAIICLSTLTGGLEALEHNCSYDIRPNTFKELPGKYFPAL
jgi:hypothetical protein